MCMCHLPYCVCLPGEGDPQTAQQSSQCLADQLEGASLYPAGPGRDSESHTTLFTHLV